MLDVSYPKEPPLRVGEAAREAFDRSVENDKLAKSTFLTFMEQDLEVIYEEYKTAKEMFDAVTKAYGIASNTYIQLLIEKYNDTVMKEGESVVDHVNKLLVIAKELVALGDPDDKKSTIGDVVSPGIVVNWISKMISEVFQWSLSSYNSLNKESKYREHGKSSILELLHFKLSKNLRIISEAQWVEASAGVKWVNHLTQRSTGNTVALDNSHQDNLCSPNSKDAPSMHQAWVAQVVKPALAEDLSSGFEPHGLAELDSITGQELGEDTS
ncbi:hypothetical protein RJ640_029080 [Escallonia rubra]|uniref:Uncharacterized protein n=1 Tax=Escallonia rubra TaxID=112253 RepID=A0AA88R4V6_9ASTE|nr:hypothetical protein RJ640_029080 [Escallonia rubra]